MINTTMTEAPLDRIAAHVDGALKGASVAWALLRRPMRREEDLRVAQDKAGEAAESARNALGLLTQQGAVLRALPPSEPISIFHLDTPANRRLLAALEAAVIAAEDVDRERGRVGEKVHANDTAGTDLAESVNQIRARVHVEIHGPAGSGKE